MSDTIEQAKSHAVRYLTLIDDKPSPQGITAIDALIAAVRAEAQREAFEAGWEARLDPAQMTVRSVAQAFAAYLTRQAQK